MHLAGKKVIITGVSKGIGYALLTQFLEKGAIVAGLGRTMPEVVHDNFRFYKTNIRKSSEVKKSFDALARDIGEGVDILINNAGLGYFGKVEDYTDEKIAEMFETNVYGLLYANRAVVPLMKANESGHIINIASTAALEGYAEVSVYCGTKHAVKAISESMYKELRDYGVKVTCVYPGSVKTDFFKNVASIEPHDYMLMPEDVATMIVQATEMPKNFHQVNLEVRPLQPRGPKSE